MAHQATELWSATLHFWTEYLENTKKIYYILIIKVTLQAIFPSLLLNLIPFALHKDVQTSRNTNCIPNLIHLCQPLTLHISILRIVHQLIYISQKLISRCARYIIALAVAFTMRNEIVDNNQIIDN